MSEEEREFLNETIRNLNNQLVDALRERDEARRERDEACAAVEKPAQKPAQKASNYRNLTARVNEVLDLTRGYEANSLVGKLAALLEQTTFYKDLYYNTLTPAQRENPNFLDKA